MVARAAVEREVEPEAARAVVATVAAGWDKVETAAADMADCPEDRVVGMARGAAAMAKVEVVTAAVAEAVVTAVAVVEVATAVMTAVAMDTSPGSHRRSSEVSLALVAAVAGEAVVAAAAVAAVAEP